MRISKAAAVVAAVLSSIAFSPSIVFAQADLQASNGSIDPITKVRTVLCGEFPSSESATELKSRLQQEGYSPVWIKSMGQTTAVFVGKCARMTDAFIIRGSLIKHSHADASMKNFSISEVDGGPDASFITPDTPLVVPHPGVYAKSLGHFDPASRPEFAPILTAIQTGWDDAATTSALNLLSSLPENDVARGWVLDENTLSIVKRMGKAKNALPKFLKVANGEVPATEEERLRARFFAADSWHYYYSNPLRAYSAYQEILREHGSDNAVRARAMVETAACLLELSGRQQAWFEEARRACLDIRNTVPSQYARAHAVADLMYGETFQFQSDRERAIHELTGFAERHPGRIREISQANLDLGLLYAQEQYWTASKAAFAQNLHQDFSNPDENFYYMGERWNMRKRSADYLLFYAKQFNDTEAAATYQSYLDGKAYNDQQPAANPAYNHAFPHSFYQIATTAQGGGE